MSACHNELLMNIPDEYLQNLAQMYREHGEIPYASSIITNGIKIRKKGWFLMRFMSPGCVWKDDGTFFAVMEFPQSYHLAIFTLDKTCKNVYEGLMRTKRLHFGRPLTFFAIHSSVYPTILKVIADKNLRVRSDDPFYIYSIPKETALNFKVDYPEEAVVRELDVSDARIVNCLWPSNFSGSQEFISSLIQMSGGYGVFLRSNDQLISWVVKTGLGQIGILQTVENYKKKGYACLLSKLLSKKIAEEDEVPTVTVSVDNLAAQNMFLKLGFENKGLCYYITLQRS